MVEYIDPTREQFGKMMKMPDDGPIHMLNLVRFHALAVYEAGHALEGAGLTGEQAYANYGKHSHPIFDRVGGKIAHSWAFRQLVIGPDTEQWDRVFVAQYPSAAAFGEMVKDPDYQIAVKHRQAAVADSRLIRMKPAQAGANFAD